MSAEHSCHASILLLWIVAVSTVPVAGAFSSLSNVQTAVVPEMPMTRISAAAGVPVVVLNSFQRERLALRWREWMTERILTLYMGAASLSPLSESGMDRRE